MSGADWRQLQEVEQQQWESDIARFMRYVEKVGDCWIWNGTRCDGYGRFSFKSKVILAHRASYYLFVGDLQKDMCVCHTCDTPSCVNPKHLFLGTQADNARDRENKGRGNERAGIHNGRAKLTVRDIHEIRESNLTTIELGRRYGVTSGHISKIKLKQLWAKI